MSDQSGDRQIVKNLIFNSFSFAINFIISFCFTPYLIRTVGKEAYSFFPLINNMIGYTSIITTAVGSMAGRFITMCIYKGDMEDANRYLNAMWVSNLILSVIFTLLSVVIVVFIGDILTVPSYLLSDVRWLFGLGVFSMVIGLLTSYLSIPTYVRNRVDLNSSRTVITSLIRIGSIFSLFAIFRPSIVYMSLSALIASVAGIIFNYNLKKRLLPELTIAPQKYFNLSYVRTLTSSGMWNSVNQLSFMLLNQFDLLITNIFIGAAITGDYAIAKTAPGLILQLVAMLSGTFFAHFNILYAKGEVMRMIEESKKSMVIVGMLMAIPIGFLIVCSKDFYTLWVPTLDSDFMASLTVWTLTPLILSASINPIFGLFNVTNHLRTPALALLIGGLVQTAVVFILLKFTDMGIWAIVITSAFEKVLRNTLFSTIYGAKCIGMKWYTFYPTLIRGICGTLVMIIVSSIIRYFIVVDSWLDLIIVGIFASAISLIINMFVMMKKTERNAVLSRLRLNNVVS